jgi:hypothetical protein
MARRVVVALVAALLAVGRAAAEDRQVVMEDGAARAELTEGAQALTVVLRVGEKHAEWKYDGFTLDPEDTGAPPAKYVDGAGGRLLLVKAYSGGAHCCWVLLAFDTKRLKALGQVLEGQSPIELLAPQKACPTAATAEPVDRRNGKPTARKLYCFTGRAFRAKGPPPK